jgi:Protein of unknown function (DUF2857)
MPKTTHAELVFHTLRYVTETLADGDIHAVLDLGFRVDQIARLERLTLRDLHHLSQVRTHFMDVAVDPECFDRVLDHIERSKHHYDLQDELIRLRAPLEMMRVFFGMTNAEYAARRQVLGMSGTGIGRPAAASEEDERRIWEAWQTHAEHPPEQRYLEVGRSTGVPLNTVWAAVRAWEAAGLFSAQRSGDDSKVIPLRRNHP